jgi:hypothetical protein
MRKKLLKTRFMGAGLSDPIFRKTPILTNDEDQVNPGL